MMRLTIIALILAIAALGLGSFATFRSFDSEDAIDAMPVTVKATWSEAECEDANERLPFLETMCARPGGDCAPFIDMLQAINDKCADPIPWTDAECEQACRQLEELARGGPACFGSSSTRCEQYFNLFQAINENCP